MQGFTQLTDCSFLQLQKMASLKQWVGELAEADRVEDLTCLQAIIPSISKLSRLGLALTIDRIGELSSQGLEELALLLEKQIKVPKQENEEVRNSSTSQDEERLVAYMSDIRSLRAEFVQVTNEHSTELQNLHKMTKGFYVFLQNANSALLKYLSSIGVNGNLECAIDLNLSYLKRAFDDYHFCQVQAIKSIQRIPDAYERKGYVFIKEVSSRKFEKKKKKLDIKDEENKQEKKEEKKQEKKEEKKEEKLPRINSSKFEQPEEKSKKKNSVRSIKKKE